MQPGHADACPSAPLPAALFISQSSQGVVEDEGEEPLTVGGGGGVEKEEGWGWFWQRKGERDRSWLK